ncbi:DNA-binding helix-turn-helix protein [Lentilactobacillus hilgardii ATCC 27305]|jgi:transcriptional regulator with XRE-family HTH domain|nr:DNA-binding helix-turn-helix protein [Lentilactobacillus hilgardii ATCC 27305]
MTMLQFSKQLKKYRAANNLSQDDLAKKLFVSRQAISKWEQGDATPDLNNLVKLAEIFNISLDTLVLGASETKSTVDQNQYTFDPTSGLYKRRYGQMNFWDFLARFWWLIFPIGGFIMAIIETLTP